MTDRSIEVRCPCCESVLEIDVRTAKVLRHAPREKLDDTGKPVLDPGRWDRARDRVQGRTGTAEDAFDAALSKERSRGRDLDDLFDRAKDKLDRRQAELGDGDAAPDQPGGTR